MIRLNDKQSVFLSEVTQLALYLKKNCLYAFLNAFLSKKAKNYLVVRYLLNKFQKV